VFPPLLEVPKLDAFEGPSPALKINDTDASPAGHAITYDQFFARAIAVIHNNFLTENGVTTHSKLNGAKWALATVDLNSVVVLAPDPRISQEPPQKAMRGDWRASTKSKEHSDRADNPPLTHLRLPVPMRVLELTKTLSGRAPKLNKGILGIAP
jgi:hypothetical protein